MMTCQVKVGQRDSKRVVNWRNIVKNVAKFWSQWIIRRFTWRRTILNMG